MSEQTNIAAVTTVSVAPVVLNPEPDHKMSNLPAAPGSPMPSAAEAKKGCFLPAPGVPTQEGPLGIRFDFNFGARVSLPEQAGGEWEVHLRDYSCDVGLFSTRMVAGTVSSAKKFFVPFEIIVARDGKEVLRHRMDLKGRKVLVQFPVGTLGDLMGWFPYATRFQEVHGCELSVSMGAPIIELFKDEYPHIRFLTPEQVNTSDFYATYNIGLFFTDSKCEYQPYDFRYVGLHRTAGFILGVDPKEFAPRLAIKDDTRPIPERYVVIATQSTTQSKYWNNVNGWRETIKFLKDNGYRVICIDQKAVHGAGTTWNQIPHGCEDQTGDRPLSERARWIKHADFFIGLSSGLSWLAWATGVPIVMISGFTHPFNEFDTPYRVINPHTCNSCWNDQHVMFDHHDFMWCPRHKGTAQQFECTRLIQPKQVTDTIRCIPAFKEQAAAHAAAAAWANASAGAVASLGSATDIPQIASV
ncbi:autotransporter strand-loop-strand O-heptosyltransferase [Burkholderia gladioli]|uniref:autotransporter strand-loop-strand O-heptosyltransferase n=1 Tax=Burkholderia gladioli TaxID=28095 RepID=UPI001FC80C40|nr:autotransporter strand-loop-strand O-heptosyltransferase [Burkholderia gladioli]